MTALVFLLLHTLQKCPTLLHSVHVLLYAGHCLGGCVLPQYLHAGHDGVLCCTSILGLLVHAGLDTFIFVKFFGFSNGAHYSCLAFCASTSSRTFPLVICSSLFTVINSFIISSSMFLTLSLWIIVLSAVYPLLDNYTVLLLPLVSPSTLLHFPHHSYTCFWTAVTWLSHQIGAWTYLLACQIVLLMYHMLLFLHFYCF